MFIFDDRILIPIKDAKLKYRIIMKNMLPIQQFIVKVSKNIDFTAYGFHRDHPPAWESLMTFVLTWYAGRSHKNFSPTQFPHSPHTAVES